MADLQQLLGALHYYYGNERAKNSTSAHFSLSLSQQHPPDASHMHRQCLCSSTFMAKTHLSKVSGGGVGKQEQLVGVGTARTPPDWRGTLLWWEISPPVLLREQQQHLLYAPAALGARPQHGQPHLQPFGVEV